MDQNSFRSFLSSTPAAREGTGRAAGVLGTSALKRGRDSGGAHTKAKDLQPKKEDTKQFVPRKTIKKNDKYQDRAEMRRLGKEDEFKAMENMLEDFEKNARDAGETEEEIARKRAYLGGDATHSILVKGLDFSLLAARKAELANEEGGKWEDDLDEMMVGKEGMDVDEEEAGKNKKGDGEEGDLAPPKKKNKKISAMEGGSSSTGAPALPSKFKSIGSKSNVEELKPKKKKKKKVAKVVEDGGASSSKQEEAEVKREAEEKTQPIALGSAAGPSRVIPTPAAPIAKRPSPPSPNPHNNDDEDDDDIFGGVGMYDNPLDDSDSDSDDGEETNDKVHAPAGHSERAPPIARARQGKGWFDDAPEEEQHIADPLAGMFSNIAGDGGGSNSRTRGDQSDSDDDDDEGNIHKPLPRLQGLSSSALPSAKDLLALDAAASAADKRREKKAKWRAKQGLAAQDADGVDDEGEEGGGRKEKSMDEKQRLNKEVQQLSAYMEKKGNKN